MNRALWISFCFCCALSISISPAAAAPTLRPVALSGDHAPGTESVIRFSNLLFAPAMNQWGETAFRGQLMGDGIEFRNGSGIWSEGTGPLKLVARAGEHAAGASSSTTFDSFYSPNINAAGQTAFVGVTTRSFGGSRGIWLDTQGNLEMIAHKGVPAPGAPAGVVFNDFGPTGLTLAPPALNAAGHVAFEASVTGTGVVPANDFGLWSSRSGTLDLELREGDPLPASSGPGSINGFAPIRLNAADQLTFDSSGGIWLNEAGQTTLVARAEDPAPGIPGYTFGLLGGHALNSAGQVAFTAFLRNDEGLHNNGLWSNATGALAPIVLPGDAAPGTPANVVFRAVGVGDFKMSSTGRTAFFAVVAGAGVDDTNTIGVWSEGRGSLQLVARGGDPAPGTPPGVNFVGSEFLGYSGMITLALNAAGQVAIYSELVGTGVDLSNNAGIWAEDRTGVLRLIARTGDALEVRPGDFRIVQQLRVLQGIGEESGGHMSSFNERGQLAFQASFTDGTSGIFVSNLVAVPEPTTIVMLILGVLGASACRVRDPAHPVDPVDH